MSNDSHDKISFMESYTKYLNNVVKQTLNNTEPLLYLDDFFVILYIEHCSSEENQDQEDKSTIKNQQMSKFLHVVNTIYCNISYSF